MARNVRVEETKDYDQFVNLHGNRKLDKTHVKRLIQKMTTEGNLTEIFPIVVNEKMEVIDGQHRLEALRQLEWPVFYELKKGLNIDTVQALNTGTRNWTWFDYAFSFAEQGNENYQRFLNMWDYFDLPYTIVLHFCGSQDNSRRGKFHRGTFEMMDHTMTFNLLKQYKEIVGVSGHQTSKFAYALFDIMRLPEYDHKRMVEKMKKFGSELKGYTNKQDYLRAIEDIYNTYVREEDKARLF